MLTKAIKGFKHQIKKHCIYASLHSWRCWKNRTQGGPSTQTWSWPALRSGFRWHRSWVKHPSLETCLLRTKSTFCRGPRETQNIYKRLNTGKLTAPRTKKQVSVSQVLQKDLSRTVRCPGTRIDLESCSEYTSAAPTLTLLWQFVYSVGPTSLWLERATQSLLIRIRLPLAVFRDITSSASFNL